MSYNPTIDEYIPLDNARTWAAILTTLDNLIYNWGEKLYIYDKHSEVHELLIVISASPTVMTGYC